jgi:ABC-type maltose transport system permease subunit
MVLILLHLLLLTASVTAFLIIRHGKMVPIPHFSASTLLQALPIHGLFYSNKFSYFMLQKNYFHGQNSH